MTTTVNFKFTTAISPVTPESGRFDKEVHESIAKKLRGRIMSQQTGDGIAGLWIERYDMSVEFHSEIITINQVKKAVEDGIAWINESDGAAFPYVNSELPSVTVEGYTNLSMGVVELDLQLDTNLYRYAATREEREAIEAEFAREILELDGVVHLRIDVDVILISIRTTVHSVQEFKEHIKALLETHAKDENSKFLPYVQAEDSFEMLWGERAL
jgi:hypothetical protein